MSKIIALDIGGVCIQLRQSAFLAKFGLTKLPVEVQVSSAAFESGKIGAEEWFAQCRQQVSALRDYPASVFWQAFRSIIGSDQPGMAELTRHWVAAGYQLIFFSNTSQVHAEEVWRKISFGERISGAVYSYEAGCMKPSPEIYQYFEKKYGRPDLYLDDFPANIEQGLKCGWPARLFTGTGELLREYAHKEA